MIWMARDCNYKTVSTDDSASFHLEVLTMARMMIVRRTLNGDWLVPVYWNVTYKVLYYTEKEVIDKTANTCHWVSTSKFLWWLLIRTKKTLKPFEYLIFCQKNHLNQQKIWKKTKHNITLFSVLNESNNSIPPTVTPGFQRERLRRRKRSRWNLDEAWWPGGEGTMSSSTSIFGVVSREGCDWFFENVWKWYFDFDIFWTYYVANDDQKEVILNAFIEFQKASKFLQTGGTMNRWPTCDIECPTQ